jgi:predicted nucleic acid-binding protein
MNGSYLLDTNIIIAVFAYDLIVVTRDAHFQEVDNLQTAVW